MKKLGQKNLYYSMLLAAVMMLLLVGYFVLMLPSLYVDYMEEQNLQAIRKQHQAYVKNGSYEGVQVKNPTACASLKIPQKGDFVELTTKMVSVKITVVNAQMKQILHEIRKAIYTVGTENAASLKQAENRVDEARNSERMDIWVKQLMDIFQNEGRLPVDIEVVRLANQEEMYFDESYHLHRISDHMVIIESSVADDNNQYTNYLAMEKVSDGIVLSMLPLVTPQMEEIRPVVMQSLPMLCAVILILVLAFSQIYSGGMILPVYRELQEANQALVEENERKEMFLRASSHQLKTPITAALLLLDGMMNQIGRYKDTKTHLPKVKEQLLSMRRMVEEILSLKQKSDLSNRQMLQLYELAQTQMAAYRVAAAEKRLELVLEGDKEACLFADGEVILKILDNLIANAVAYTPPEHRICIMVQCWGYTVLNEGAKIPEEILPHIFDPFVRGNHETSSHGLGLYIAAYYAKSEGAELSVKNQDHAVEAVLKLKNTEK